MPAFLLVLASSLALPAQAAEPDCLIALFKANTVEQLESLVVRCPELRQKIEEKMPIVRIQQQLQELETSAISKLEEEGISNRFFIPDLAPDPQRTDSTLGSRLTLKQEDGSLKLLGQTFLMIREGAFRFPSGELTLFRFTGEVDLALLPFGINKHRVVSEGDELNPLTFCIYKGSLVYLRGKGKVVVNRKKIPLG